MTAHILVTFPKSFCRYFCRSFGRYYPLISKDLTLKIPVKCPIFFPAKIFFQKFYPNFTQNFSQEFYPLPGRGGFRKRGSPNPKNFHSGFALIRKFFKVIFDMSEIFTKCF